jgi:hypothetical protein
MILIFNINLAAAPEGAVFYLCKNDRLAKVTIL